MIYRRNLLKILIKTSRWRVPETIIMTSKEKSCCKIIKNIDGWASWESYKMNIGSCESIKNSLEEILYGGELS